MAAPLSVAGVSVHASVLTVMVVAVTVEATQKFEFKKAAVAPEMENPCPATIPWPFGQEAAQVIVNDSAVNAMPTEA